MTQKEKSDFRASGKWKKFRNLMKKKCNGIDYISGRPLPKGANLHHLDEAHYDDLNEDKFVFLGKTMHKMVHFLFVYYRKDPDVIKRLEEILKKMKEYEDAS